MTEVISTAFYMPLRVRSADRKSIIAAFVQDLLCYDTVILASDQMAALGPLLEVMSPSTLERAVEEGTIRFIHDRQILAWPKRLGYTGIVPVIHLESVAQPEGRIGYTQLATAEIVSAQAVALGTPKPASDALARVVADATSDFRGLESSGEPRPLADVVLDELDVYEELVAGSTFAVKAADIIRLKAAIHDPKKSPLKTKQLNVARASTEPGWKALETVGPLGKKQAALLHLYLADRILAISTLASEAATVHTDQTVEEVLATRVARIRKAAGSEVDEVLNMAKVDMPMVHHGEGIDFARILDARTTSAGKAFRRVVAERDARLDETLLQAYYRELEQGFADRMGARVARFVSTLVGDLVTGGLPVLSAIDAVLVDRLLARRDARYFIDEELPRALGGSKGGR